MSIDLLRAHVRDLGNFTVKRVLPAAQHPMVGPFIFFDHMGPALMAPGQGMDVRPHPHIGLATVTYLFEGSGLHRDSLGSVQPILPGDVNWMVAGRGIVHSERTPPDDLAVSRTLHGIQVWVALPLEMEQAEPAFSHHPRASLPTAERAGVEVRVILGSAFGLRSPAPQFSPLFYAHATFAADAALTLDTEHVARAVYAVDADIEVDGALVPVNQMAVLAAGQPAAIRAPRACQVMLLGGAPFAEPRYIHWNFVASSRSLISAARASWRSYPNPQFAQVPDETEWIPLP